jgi:hypothetical protein
MKSLKKKTPAKNLRLRKVSKAQDDNTTVLDLGNSYDAAYPYDSITCGIDTITLDPSIYSAIGSLTLPTTSTMSMSTGYTIGTGSTTSPYTYTTTGTTGINSGYSFNNNPTTVQINTDGLTMASGTDITVGGKSLTKAIEQIEERLGILHPNAALEERWDKLKDLRRQYMEMEKDILEKEKIMKILKEA